MQRDGYHPDRGGDAATAALINKAYAVLKDPARQLAFRSRRGTDVLAHVAGGFDAFGEIGRRDRISGGERQRDHTRPHAELEILGVVTRRPAAL